MAPIALGGFTRGLALRSLVPIDRFLVLSSSDFKIFEGQLSFVFAELLRLFAETGMAQFSDQVVLTLGQFLELIDEDLQRCVMLSELCNLRVSGCDLRL